MNGASVKFASQVNCYGVSLYASLNNESTDMYQQVKSLYNKNLFKSTITQGSTTGKTICFMYIAWQCMTVCYGIKYTYLNIKYLSIAYNRGLQIVESNIIARPFTLIHKII